MKRTTTCALITTAVLLVLGGGRVRAEMIDFSYSWSIAPSPVLSSGTGTVSLTLASDGSSSVPLAAPPTFIPAASITTSSSATLPPDVFNTPFSLKLHLTDTASGTSGDLTFSGTVSGELTATSSTLTSTFNDPVTRLLTLGGGIAYTVSIDPVLTSLPAPGAGSSVLLDARVSAERPGLPGGGDVGGGGDGGGGDPIKTPEPSSLVLGGSALLLLGLARRRLRRTV